ncbi:MAG: hypothetical protein LBQ54_06805, partial [Planctomycetaceae bacterium]|nr:hypothetical protein [Planctomycetaceae bacterium]
MFLSECNFIIKSLAMKNFLLSNFLWLTFPFSPYCYSTEIIRYEDQADIAIKMIDLTKAQETGIWSWSGTLDIVQKHYVDKSENKLLMEKIFAINFVFDYRNNFSKVVLVPSEFYVFENGEKRPQPLQNESLLCKENVYYRYLAYQRTSKEQKNDDKILNTLTISYTHPKDLPSSFEPLRMSSWPNGIEDIYTIFEIYGLSDEDLRQLLMTKDKMSKEQADQFVTKLKGEGHPYMKMSQKDNLVTITRTLNGMTYVFDLSKGARPISCSNIAGNRSSWKCEFQSVSGFWIPKTTNEILIFPNGESKETVMIWNG